VKAGADVIQVFDSWGGLLSPADFEEFSLRYIRQIITAVKEDCYTIIFAKGAWFALEQMQATGANGTGLDWCVQPQVARKLAGNNITLQGNFDPAKLLAPVKEIRQSVKQMIDAFGTDRYIANLGHGILPNVPVEHARAFVDAVKEYRV
jgi:uroporphyrinogen decarboxylase